MDSLSTQILKNPSFFPSISSSRPIFSFTNRFGRTSFKANGFHPGIILKIPSFNSSPFTVSAHLERGSKRRNSLRKKLYDNQKVHIDPSFNFDNQIYEVETFDSNMNSRGLEESISSSSIEKSKLFGESVLWNKLENWVDQYKKDVELWGIGTGHVFTVFKDLDGNVERVSVNEDEILNRSRIEPSLFKQEEMGESFMDVKLKVAHAKRLAREIETGEYELPKNSSVAKFVVEGSKQSGFRNGIHAVRLDMVPKLSQIGFVVFCGCLVFWSVKKFLMVGNEGEELSREEKERLEIGGVEVLSNASTSLMESTERPQFNREELMNTIMKAKASGEGLTLADSSSNVDGKSREFNRKVQEIKEMARQARENERENKEKGEDANEETSNKIEQSEMDLREHNLNDVFDEDTMNSVGTDANLKPPSLDDPTTIETGSLHEGATMQTSSEMSVRVQELERIDVYKDEDVNQDCSAKMGDEDINGELGVRNLSDVIDGDMVKLMGIDATLVPPSINEPLKEDTRSLLKGEYLDASENEGSHAPAFSSNKGSESPQSSIGDIETNENSNSSFLDRKEDPKFLDPPTDESQYLDQSSKSLRPRVILSVKEAREYLSRKHKQKELGEEPTLPSPRQREDVIGFVADEEVNEKPSETIDKRNKAQVSCTYAKTIVTKPFTNACENSTINIMGVDRQEENQSFDAPHDKSYYSNRSSDDLKPTVTRSAKEAREYYSQKDDRKELCKEPKLSILGGREDVLGLVADEEDNNNASQMMAKEKEVHDCSIRDQTSKNEPVINPRENSTPKKMALDDDGLQSIPFTTNDPKYIDKNNEMGNLQMPKKFLEDTDVECSAEPVPPITRENWIEKNFKEFEPIAKKIGDGFRGNYMVAKEKSEEQLNLSSELNLGSDEDELDWMKDDSLREIVFQVRENELMGRNPFHMMDAKDKHAFFEGLEKKVEKENAKLLNLHEWVHSKIENLDYGADGISVYDPPEKVIPRWKGPPVDKNPEFLNSTMKRRETFFAENLGVSLPVKQDAQDALQKSVESPIRDNSSTSPAVHNSKRTPQSGVPKNPKTVIESSDGSSRVGKKSEKEYWQHTKKWSREFLEVYNAETDPEVKSVMKDMGKDLDRWITEKELEEVGDLMTNIPERRRRFIEKKLEKLKREMEMFGPQAVVSKYREYADEKEEDYLWWLDLPFVLCLELCTAEDGVQEVGFYSLEMAADLELDPKQYHVIAFEDPGDSKSFCYIIQAHMETNGCGHAFVVARPPKDVFREAKANSFSVTVIRKGQLQLNVDQTLEDVEEQITEIGSKIYHDKIMRERSMDIGSLMKGVFGGSKPAKRRRLQQMLKKPPQQ